MHENYGINVRSHSLLKTGVQNSNFKISTTKGMYILRKYNFKNIDDIDYTLKVLHTLNKSNFPCPKLTKTIDGHYHSLYQNRPVIVYEYIPGRNIRQIPQNLLDEIAMLQAKMHLLLYKRTDASNNLTWDYNDLLMLINQKENEIIESGLLGASELIDFVRSEMDQIVIPNNLPKGGTHQDIKPGNVIVYNNHINGIVDFDNGYWGDLLHDITTTICWYCFSSFNFDINLYERFMSSYQKIRELDKIEKDYICQSIKYRLLRESIIWPMYVSHNIKSAKKYSDYFLNCYYQFDISEARLINVL